MNVSVEIGPVNVSVGTDPVTDPDLLAALVQWASVLMPLAAFVATIAVVWAAKSAAHTADKDRDARERLWQAEQRRARSEAFRDLRLDRYATLIRDVREALSDMTHHRAQAVEVYQGTLPVTDLYEAPRAFGLHRSSEEIDLLSPTVGVAAKQLADTAGMVCAFAWSPGGPDPRTDSMEYRESVKRAQEAIEAFVAAAKADLGTDARASEA